MNQIIKIFTSIILTAFVLGSLGFTYLQIHRSSTLDQALVSDLTTQLNTSAIDKAINNLTPTQ